MRPKMPGKVIPEGASSSPSAAPIRASATAFAGASVIFSAPSTSTVFARPLSRNAQAVWSASDPEPHAASTRRAGGRWGKSEEASAPRPAWSFAVSASMFATTTRSISSGLMPEERRAAVAASLMRSRRLFSHHSPKRVSPEPARKMSCRIFRRSGKERSDVLEVFVVLQVCPLALVRRKRPSVFQHREEERVAPRAGAVGDEEDALSALRFLEHRREADERACAVGVADGGDDESGPHLLFGDAALLGGAHRELRVGHVEDRVVYLRELNTASFDDGTDGLPYVMEVAPPSLQ